MTAVLQQLRHDRRARGREMSRKSILEAARRVAAREGARNLSLRSVAAEAGFTPAALYVYFRDKDELMLALASDDLARLAQVMREAKKGSGSGLSAATSAALDLLANTETLAAASGAIAPDANGSDVGRLFNGRMIAALTALSDATGERAKSREDQADVVLMAAALAGLAMMVRGGRLEALGFSAEEVLERLDTKFMRSEPAA